MTAHLPVLIVVIPLLAAIVTPLLARLSPRLSRGLTIGALAAALTGAIGALSRVLAEGTWRYHLGGWAPPWGIEYVIDPLSGGMAVLVSFFALVVSIYAGPNLERISPARAGIVDGLFLLLTAGLLGMVVTGDLFNLYVFLEISSLSAYALLSSGGNRAVLATFRYLLVGTIGASFYLLGVGYLYALTGALTMSEVHAAVDATASSSVFAVSVALMVAGLAIKTALFPLHGWLPDVYTYAPAPVTGFISAVMTKVSIYALFRILYFVLDARGAAGQALVLLGWAAALAVVAGSVMALAQTDIRRMLAYSSVSHMGYIVLGLSLANPTAVTGALLHLLNHATMKACLFLVVGGVRWRTGVSDIADFAGMGRRLPLTMAAFSVTALSMVGLPPLSGFFSKWYLVLGAIEGGAWPFVLALILSSLLSAVYFFRVIERAYFASPPTPDGATGPGDRSTEIPGRMLGPILVLAAIVSFLGIFNQTVVVYIIERALPVF